MPSFNDTISRVQVSQGLTRHHPTNIEKMLQWIQDNQSACKHTTLTRIAEVSLIPGMNVAQRKQCLYGLSRDQFIIIKNHGRGNRSKKDIYINYLRQGLPQSVVDNAPDKDIEDAKKVLIGEEIKAQAKQITAHGNKPEEPNKTVEVPLKKEILQQGFSLTLNINFIVK